MLYGAQDKGELLIKDWTRALELDNDATGLHFVKAIFFEADEKNYEAAQEYRAFIKDADIVYYDVEIIAALDRIVELEEAD